MPFAYTTDPFGKVHLYKTEKVLSTTMCDWFVLSNWKKRPDADRVIMANEVCENCIDKMPQAAMQGSLSALKTQTTDYLDKRKAVRKLLLELIDKPSSTVEDGEYAVTITKSNLVRILRCL